tara:strand:- start:108 stop:356 length:249 start_codon:yes stop_codon:yes gene_type:complete
MIDQKISEVADSIDYLSEQFRRKEGEMGSHNVVHALDRIARSLWDGLRAEGYDSTIPDGLFAVAQSLNKIADAINQSKGESE